MNKKIFLCICLGALCLSGCSPDATPMNVVFKDQTAPFSPRACLTIVYAEDKRIRDKSTDVLVKSEVPNLELSFTKENGKTFDVVLDNANQWYSLTQLFSPKLAPATFARVETTTYVITCPHDATIWFKAVGGDAVYHLGTGQTTLENTFDVSVPFKMDLLSNAQNA